MPRLIPVLILLAVALSACASRQPLAPGEGPVVRLTDFGAVPNDGEDDTEAFHEAYRAVEKAARQAGGAVLELGPGTYDLTPGPPPRNYLYRPQVDGVTLRGAGMHATILRLWAAPENAGEPRRDPRALINHRGAFCRLENVRNLTWEGFTLDGQAPPTHRMNDWWTPEARRDGWDITHKGWLWTGTATGQVIRQVRATNFRGEIWYAGGGDERREILIEDSEGEGCNGSLFSFSATLTLRRCRFSNFGQGVENYAFPSHDTRIEGCEIDASGWLYHGHDSSRPALQEGSRYRIRDNRGGLDVTNLGAPDNRIGTEFVANASAAPREWGRGSVERFHHAEGIVVFNQRGSRVEILDTTIRNADRAILITDFAHDWTIDGLTLEDCRYGIYWSGLRTSSSPADHLANAGAHNFTIRDLRVRARAQSMQAAFSLFPGGSRLARNWNLSKLHFEEAGATVVKAFELGSGCQPPFVVSDSDLRALRPAGDVSSTSYRPRFLNCTLRRENWDGGLQRRDVFVPPHEGTFLFRFADQGVVTVDPDSGPYLPDGFRIAITGVPGQSFELRWITEWTAGEPILATTRVDARRTVELQFDADGQVWRTSGQPPPRLTLPPSSP